METKVPKSPRRRPEWVEAEYDRIGAEREQASREATRAYRWELFRACMEVLGWTVAGLVIAAFGFHVTDYETGMIFLYSGMLVNWSGAFWSIFAAYRRGQKRGDW